MSDAPEKLFRAAALKRLSNPEALDRAVSIGRPLEWLAAVALFAMIVAAIGWSVWGLLPTRVPATGIVLAQGGRVLEVQARGSGTLIQLQASVGDQVSAGQVIGRLGESDGERELAALRQQYKDGQRDLAQAEAGAATSAQLRTESLDRQRQAMELRLRIANMRETTLRERVAVAQGMLRDGLTTRPAVILLENELQAVLQELSNAASDLASLGAEEHRITQAELQRLTEQRAAIADIERRIMTLEGNLDSQLLLRAPADGVVVEVRVPQGGLVGAGQAVLALEQRGEGLEVFAFVDSQRGKLVRAGMEARVELTSARKEEFGTLVGAVTSVSEFPLSFDAVRALMQNDELARSFLHSGPPFLARVTLERDNRSASGYRWTSSRGEQVTVSSGIPTRIEIVTEYRHPIALVIPALRRILAL